LRQKSFNGLVLAGNDDNNQYILHHAADEHEGVGYIKLFNYEDLQNSQNDEPYAGSYKTGDGQFSLWDWVGYFTVTLKLAG